MNGDPDHLIILEVTNFSMLTDIRQTTVVVVAWQTDICCIR